jgi:glycosyltransferase involved in cell wall biosynthesis
MFVEQPQRLRADRDIDVLWVSNIRRLKRPERVLALAESLPRLGFHMIGGALPAEPACFGEVERAAAAMSNVVLHGRLPYTDANDVYGRAKVLVNTSEIEGFPNSYLQAWIRGVPVVTFLDPDNVIEREGLGVAVRTPSQMRAATRRLVEDTAAREAASERCLAFMEREYAEPKVLTDYVRAFEDALGGSVDSRRTPSSATARHA